MKQITIYEFLEKYKNTVLLDGYKYVGYDKYGWWAFKEEPEAFDSWVIDFENAHHLVPDIVPFDGDWKDSLIKVEHKEEDALIMVDKSTGPEWYKNGKRIK